MLVPVSFHGHVAAMLVVVLLAGCASKRTPTAAPALDPTYRDDLQVSVVAPPGWTMRPPKVEKDSTTQVWVSPSGATSLGVIRFRMPLPVGHEWALWGFLQNMKKSEGRADLLEKQWDDAADALRFVAEGGRYLVRAKLSVRGVDGWAIFAGTRTESPINDVELDRAVAAREAVRVR